MKDQDIDIVVLTLADKSDNSPAHMVSEKWLKQQRKRGCRIEGGDEAVSGVVGG